MNRTVVVLVFSVLLSATLLWAGGVALVSWRQWPETRRAVERIRDTGQAECTATYSDPEAKDRCADLHSVKFVADLNIARATRALIGGGPLIVLLLAAVAIRRSARSNPPAPSRS